MAKKFVRKNIMMTEANAKWLEKIAKEEDRTQTDIIDEALYNYKHCYSNRLRREKELYQDA